FVYNLVAEDTREGKVLRKLFEKLEEIRKAMGTDKVFDVLSEILYNRNLSQLLMEAAANARGIDDILKDLDIRVDEDYIAQVRDNLGESLATRYIDYTRIGEMARQAREYRLIPEYTESYFKKTFRRAGGKLRELKDGFLAIDAIPYDLCAIGEREDFRKGRGAGALLKRYPKVTFDKDVAFRNPDAEFVSFGHPLFESLMEWVERQYPDVLTTGAVFTDPDGQLDGHVLFYEGEIRDGAGGVAGKRLFAFYVAKGGIRHISPAIIWDLAEGGAAASPTDIDFLRRGALGPAIAGLEAYKGELLNERQRQAAIKEKYGVKSLEHLILKLDGDLISLYDRKNQGENVDLAIHNAEE
ncbi:MAG: helicase, partial [Syntrophobacteraceae bacterium CG23_combo_of_CG06-09_8_20_14_all_50_8]